MAHYQQFLGANSRQRVSSLCVS